MIHYIKNITMVLSWGDFHPHPPQGHLSMSGDIFICRTESGMPWHLASQGGCLILCNTQNSPKTKNHAAQTVTSEFQNPGIREQ